MRNVKAGALCLSAMLLCLSVPPSVHGKSNSAKAAAAKVRVLAIVLSEENNKNSSIVHDAAAALRQAASVNAQLRLLSDSDLKKKLRNEPAGAVGACGADLGCIAKLCKKAGADELLYGRIVPIKGKKGSFGLQVIVVGARSQKIERKLALEVPQAKELAALIKRNLSSLLGVEESEPELVALAPTSKAAPPAGDKSSAAKKNAGAPASDTPAVTALTAAPEPMPGADEPMLVAIPPPPEEQPPAPVRRGLGKLGYVGIGLLGAGVAGAGVGAYFGLDAKSTRGSIETGPGGSTQLEAKQLSDNANRSAKRANLFIGLGGGLAAAGATLLAVDLLTSNRARVSTSVTVDNGGMIGNLCILFSGL